MPITVTQPPSGAGFVDHLAAVLEFLSFDAVLLAFNDSFLSLQGTFGGVGTNILVTGTGFEFDAAEGYIAAGAMQDISLSSEAGRVGFADLDITMADLTPLILAEGDGSDGNAVETFLMTRAWDVTLGDDPDVMSRATVVGAGLTLDLLRNDYLNGRGGDDVLFAGDGNDYVDGGDGNDRLMGGAGADDLAGGLHDDRLIGGAGSDLLLGEEGRDVLNGGSGRDYLSGGAGNDILIGGAGSDVFRFEDAAGTDRIRDFDTAAPNEVVDLADVAGIVDYDDLVARHMRQRGDDVVINDRDGTKIVLLDTALADLDRADFLF
jgi:Ca2+-binding RTX toxin-like protein